MFSGLVASSFLDFFNLLVVFLAFMALPFFEIAPLARYYHIGNFRANVHDFRQLPGMARGFLRLRTVPTETLLSPTVGKALNKSAGSEFLST
jgi:hypothetical protein